MIVNITKNPYTNKNKRESFLVDNMPSYVIRGLAGNDLNMVPVAMRKAANV